jgi:hypothetical protein
MGPGTVYIKHKNDFQGNQKILQFYQIEKSSSGLQIEAVELENLITLRNGNCKKKNLILFLSLLVVSKFCFFSAVSQTHLILAIILSFFKQTGSLFASEGCFLNFLLPDNLIELDISEYLHVFCTYVKSVMLLAYTAEPLLKTGLREELFIP